MRIPVDRPRNARPFVPELRAGAWHLAVLLLVVLVPAQYRFGRPVWDSTPEIMVQSLIGGVGYLLAALVMEAGARLRQTNRLLASVLAVAVTFGAISGITLILPALPLSRVQLAVAGALSLLSLFARMLPRRFAMAAPIALAIAFFAVLNRGLAAVDHSRFSLDSENYLLNVRVHRLPGLGTEQSVEGGGLTRIGRDFLHVTGDGRFSRLSINPNGDLERFPMSLSSPANIQAFREGAGPGVHFEWFRVIDLLADQIGDSVRILVSHHHWNAEARCFTLRVSSSVAAAGLNEWSPWRPFFDAKPCLQIRRNARGLPFQGSASGGRMQRVAGGVLLTVGDHQFDGLNAPEVVSQDSASDYGKIILVRDDGSSRIYSSGHRNPQGLTVDAAGRIWSTEHGPRGGDELNLITDGANYGWPWRTTGTEYSLRTWPLQRDPSVRFREPSFSFVPSPGISSLISIRSELFDSWNGDLVVGTLKARELLRIRLDGDRPVFVEELRIGFEIRDLDEAADGTLVVWTDQGVFLTIQPSRDESSGAAVALTCTGCHTLNEGQFGTLGPNLYRVVNRPVARIAGYSYSESMREFGGRWTNERLDAFLTDPAATIPGTTMTFPGIADSVARRNLINYLAGGAMR